MEHQPAYQSIKLRTTQLKKIMQMYKNSDIFYQKTNLFKMIFMFLFLFLGMNVSFAAKSYSQLTTLSVNVTDKTIKEVFDVIEKNSEFIFIYSDKTLDLNKKVSINTTGENITDILDKLFISTNIQYIISDRQVALSKKTGNVSVITNKTQQNIRITGTVTDASGEALPGVNVVVKGTTIGITTDVDGKYSITVPDRNAVLTFSYIGYAKQEMTVGNQTTINIVLAEDTSEIEEVVVVGYGTQRKISVTGSIASVKAADLTVAPVASTTNALAGRLPGLISQQSSGQPGSDAASLSIRGYGTALVIVDGVEVSSFNSIDANQIESVTILKDGSASIYGSRAGNGVILVTTKRGMEQKPTITLNTSYTLQGITYFPKMSSAGQFAELQREEHLNAGRDEATAPYTLEQVQKYYDGTDPQYPNTDWFDELLRNWGPEQQYNLSIRGGSEKIKYYGYLGYMGQETMFKKNGGDYKRYNLQSNIDAEITKGLSLKLDLAAIYENSLFGWRGMHAGANSIWQDLWATWPIYPATLPDPTKISYANGGGVGNVGNVIDHKASGSMTRYTRSMRGTGVLTYKIPGIEGLSAKLFMNYIQSYSGSDQFTKPTQFYTYDYGSDTYTLRGQLGSAAQLRVRQDQGRTVTGQFSLHYDRVFASVHNLSVLALYEGIDSNSRWISAGRDDYLSASIEQLFAGNSGTAINDGSASEMGRSSYVGRLNYSYMYKYLFETTLRADASAKFAPKKRWGYFPSVSLGWRLSEEEFMKSISIIDDLKLRASYGSSGNDGVVNFQYLSAYSIDRNYIMANTIRQGILSTGMANPDLTWEEIKIYNAAVDWSLLNRKLYGTVDIFYRTRSGIPATRLAILPNTFGATLPQENLNSINNRGFELEVGSNGKIGDLIFDINANIAWARAKWDHYEEPEYTDPDQEFTSKISGEWTDRRLMYKSDGLFTSQAEIDALPFDQDQQGNASLRPGDIRYVDLNGDGNLDWRDQVKIAGTTPLWTGGITLNLKYKNFDLSALFQGAFGHTRNVILNGGNVNAKTYELRWSENNNDRNALIPRLGGASTNGLTSDYRLQKASYIRLKTLSVGYNLPDQWLKSIGCQQARIFISGFNLLTFNRLRKYGVDPEMPDGYGGYYYPQQRTISFGLNVSF
jgi:TonB-linked SusC/RagA family outer membrane protein